MDGGRETRSPRLRRDLVLLLLGGLALSGALLTMPTVSDTPSESRSETKRAAISLPAPETDGSVPLEKTLSLRRSVRSFSDRSLTAAQVSQVLWAAQGTTHGGERRTTPSAGALYPLEVYIAVGTAAAIPPGLYHYEQGRNRLMPVREGDLRRALTRAAWNQEWMERAAAIVVITAVHGRSERKYGDRAERYVAIEVGCAGQNVYLQATALGLGTTMVGAFDDDRVHDLLGLPADHRPMALIPVGHPR